MSVISGSYLLIFAPLIFAVFCQIFGKGSQAYFTAIFACIFCLLGEIWLFHEIFHDVKIANDLQISVLSLALEFNIDILSIVFLLALTLVKTVILIFFRYEIQKNFSSKDQRVFYSIFLLHLFALIGIFTTNNIINLFFLLELYALCFFATSSISKNFDLAKLSFKYFCLNAVSAILIFLCFLLVYLTLKEVNFAAVAQNFVLIPKNALIFSGAIFLILSFAFVIKFFPFWLYFEKLKNPDSVANFLTVDAVFIKSGIGIYLALKFIYLFFGNNLLMQNFNLPSFLLPIALILVVFCSFKILQQKNLKSTSVYVYLSNIGFVVAAVCLQSIESLRALFFYFLGFLLLGLAIFLIASFLQKNFSSSNFHKIHLFSKNHKISAAFAKASLALIIFIPFGSLFYGNLFMILAALKSPFFMLILAVILFSGLANFIFLTRFISPNFSNKKLQADFTQKIEPEEKLQILGFLVIFLVVILQFLASGYLNQISLKFASYLLSNTI